MISFCTRDYASCIVLFLMSKIRRFWFYHKFTKGILYICAFWFLQLETENLVLKHKPYCNHYFHVDCFYYTVEWQLSARSKYPHLNSQLFFFIIFCDLIDIYRFMIFILLLYLQLSTRLSNSKNVGGLIVWVFLIQLVPKLVISYIFFKHLFSFNNIHRLKAIK